MPKTQVSLVDIFQSITQSLVENQGALDQADEYNHDHGDNMVQTFRTITNALEKKNTASDSAALRYASQKLAKKSTSSSGKLYADHLAQAADQFEGQKVDATGALQLLQTLIGGAQAAQPASQGGGGDPLAALLGGLAGGGGMPGQPATSGEGDDPLAALLGGLAGGGGMQGGQSGGGDPLAMLLGGLAGGGGMQGGQSGGGDPLAALLGGLVGGAPAQSQGSGDLLGSLLGSLVGGPGASQGSSSSAGGNLLGALLSGLVGGGGGSAGGGLLPALVQAFLGGSGMGRAPHREQSTQVVVDSFLQALGSSTSR